MFLSSWMSAFARNDSPTVKNKHLYTSYILIFTCSDHGQISTRLEGIMLCEIFILHVQGETHHLCKKSWMVTAKN